MRKTSGFFPTFAVAPLIGGIFHFIKVAGVNLKGLLHGEQKVILHQPIPTSGTFNTTGCCRSIYDKGEKGALFTVDFETRDQNGELLFTNILVGWDRTAGNFGGQPGPKAEKVVVPEEEPFFQKEYKTSPDQAALYRLSGDKNPLHIDPEFAKLGGTGQTDFTRTMHLRLCRPSYPARRPAAATRPDSNLFPPGSPAWSIPARP